jgi:hypothetical protein
MGSEYRCYLLDADRVVAAKNVQSGDDAGAVLKADEILAASSCTVAEIWQGKRRVSILSRKTSAASTPPLGKRQAHLVHLPR